MSDLRLYALTSAGPQRLAIPASACDFSDLYTGLSLGAYTVLRTFDHNKFLWLDQHLERTRQSMRLLGWTDQFDEANLRRTLHCVCTAFPAPEMRVRIDILAQPAHALGVDSRLLLALASFHPLPKAYYTEGVAVGLVEGMARPNPLAKTANFVAARKALAAGAPGNYEWLMVNSQREILEGVSSNFYAFKDGVLYTAGSGVLEGITRHIILHLAAQLGIEVRLDPIRVDDVSQLSEAAISSSSRGLLPVVNIDGRIIGTGRPGPLCRRLMAAYDEFVAREIKPAHLQSP
jgi:branched-chain amino acid aminotransferase